jgi:hypothetical protein
MWLIGKKGVLTLKNLRVKKRGWQVPHHFLQFTFHGRRKIRNE